MNPTILLDHERDAKRHTVHVLLNIEADAPAGSERMPLNIAVVLDRSGSMSGPKLTFARHAAVQLMERLYPEDIASIVTFETDVQTLCAAAPRRDQRELAEQVSRIEPAGMTNLSGGWLEGRRQLARHFREEGVNRLILMTDGLANRGIVDPDHLSLLFAEARTSGVTTSTIGFGRDFVERLLARLADSGGGNTHYIEHPDQAPAVFQSEVDELLSLTAQNLTADIRLAEGVDLVAVHHSYPREIHATGLRLRLGDLYGSAPKQLLLELSASAASQRHVPLATLELTGDALSSDGGVRERRTSLQVGFSPAESPLIDPEVRRAMAFLRAAAARRDAAVDACEGRVAAGAARLRYAAGIIRDSASDAAGDEEAGDLDLMATQMEAGSFSGTDEKYLRQRSYDSARSRPHRATLLSRVERRKGEVRE